MPRRAHRARSCAGRSPRSAPLFAVSALTGEGLDALRTALHDELAPHCRRATPTRRSICRSTASSRLPGSGNGRHRNADARAASRPANARVSSRAARRRTFAASAFSKSTRKRVEAGSRVALNLPGIDRGELARGQAIVGREFSARTQLCGTLHAAGEARAARCAAARRFARTSDPRRSLGTLVVRRDARRCDASARGAASARARRRLSRLALRLAAPVADDAAGRRLRRRRRRLQPLDERVDAGEEAVLDAAARRAASTRSSPSEIASAANLREDATRAALERLAERGDVVRVARPDGLRRCARRAGDCLSAMLAQLDEAHRQRAVGDGHDVDRARARARRRRAAARPRGRAFRRSGSPRQRERLLCVARSPAGA